MAKQVELSVRCVVKGYHECPFEVNVGEIFYAFKKRGERGNAFSPVFNQVFHKPSETKQKSAYKKPTHSAKSRMIPCVLYFFDERYEKKIIIMLHIVFLLALFSLFLDASMIHCIMVLLHSLIYQASVLSVVECLLYATLEAHYIFLLTIILLSSLSVARVNVQDVCSWPACVYSGSMTVSADKNNFLN